MKATTIVTIDGVDLEVKFNQDNDETGVGYHGEIEIESVNLRYPDSDISELLNNKNPLNLIIEKLWKLGSEER